VGVSPVVRRRRLAAELRRLRSRANATLEEVAEYLECSPSKLRRIEAGQVSTRVQDVRGMLDCYHATDAERETLIALARQSRGKGWWHAYSDLISEDFQTFIGLEDEASAISPTKGTSFQQFCRSNVMRAPS
jgi:transcriptional regulator with XRE-family HTH domain